MEAELDSSAMGQSFEKARNSISETQTLTRTEMKHLEMIGPLDQITEDEQRGPAAGVCTSGIITEYRVLFCGLSCLSAHLSCAHTYPWKETLEGNCPI